MEVDEVAHPGEETSMSVRGRASTTPNVLAVASASKAVDSAASSRGKGRAPTPPQQLVMASPYQGFAGAASAQGSPAAPSLRLSPCKKEVKVETEQDSEMAYAVTAGKQAWEIRHGLGDDFAEQELSFFELCNNGTAEAGARRFLSLLTLHMDGVVGLSQDEPFGDIHITRGHDWDAWGAVRYQ